MKNVLKAIALVGTGAILTLGSLIAITYYIDWQERNYHMVGYQDD